MKLARAFRTRRRRHPGRPNSRWARWVARLVPLFFLGLGLYLLADAIQFAGRAVEAEGEVLSVSVSKTRDHETGSISYSYTPQIRFTTSDGATHVSPTHLSSSNYDYAAGARLQILYDPSDPTEVRIDSIWSLYLLPVLFTAFGLLFFALFNFFGRKAKSAEVAPEPEPPAKAPAPSEPIEDDPRSRYEDRPPTVRR